MEWNDFSAALSKCPFPRLQDFPLALELGARANQTTGGKNPVILDTLAWAYFRNGEVSKAIETVRYALLLLPATGTGRETGLRKEISDTLAEFEKAR
jgi:hypothetical protein